MMFEKLEREVIRDGKHIAVHLRVSNQHPWRIKFSGLGYEKIFENEDLFTAAWDLREWLETKGAFLLCACSMKNAGYSKAVSDREAFIFRLGESPTELIDLFKPIEPSDVATIQEQREFSEAWIESWRNRKR